MYKKIYSILLLIISLVIGIIPDKILASENNFMVSEIIDLNQVKIGDTIVIYENEETGEKFVVDILDSTTTRGIGTDDWSSGSIPYETVTLYPHIETAKNLYRTIGFYVTYSGYSIVDTYGETIICNRGVISDVNSHIITATPTAYVHAKAQMNWVNTLNDSITQSVTCFLRIEINNNNQMRLAWQINPY